MNTSSGFIKNIGEDNFTIRHLCDSSEGSSGGPLININHFQVIGIHKGGAKDAQNFNLGTFIKEPIEKFKQIIGNEEKNDNLKKELKISEKKEKNIIEEKKTETKNDEDLNDCNQKKIEDTITIQYKVEDISYIRVFGDNFVKNNKELCKIIIGENEYKLSTYIESNINQLKNEMFEIKLKGINKIIDMSEMFYSCDNDISVSCLPDISKFDTKNIVNMSKLFMGCEDLSPPDISNWDTRNVKNMSKMFHNCKNFLCLPDISK